MKISILAAIAVFGFAGAASAQSSASANATANATIVAPITLTSQDGISFGNIVGGTAGLVTVDPAGARTIASANNPGPSQLGTIGAQHFVVGGQATFAWTLTAGPAASIVVTNGTDNMTVDNLTFSLNSGVVGTTDHFTMGGTLHVTSAASNGLYSGSAVNAVTVAYN